MTLAIFYALLSLALTSFNDLVFKMFADKMRSKGGYVALIGVVWLLVLLPALPWLGLQWAPFPATLFWGLLSGTFSVVANILLLEAMGRQSAGLCSTIYRLNMVFVVAGAFLLLGESIAPFQWIGILLALLAILAFLPTGSNLTFSKAGFYMALVAAILRAMMGLAYKYAFSECQVNQYAVVILNNFCWIFGGLLYARLRERNVPLLDRQVALFGSISGILVGGIVICMAASLHAGDASLVLPIAQMSFLFTFVLSVCFLHEKADRKKLAALALGVAAIAFLTYGAA